MENPGADDPLAALAQSFARKTWGDHTVLSLVATYSDSEGNFEIALLDEGSGQPVWEPVKCNVNDTESELHSVMDDVYGFYADWQSTRNQTYGEWKATTPS